MSSVALLNGFSSWFSRVTLSEKEILLKKFFAALVDPKTPAFQVASYVRHVLMHVPNMDGKIWKLGHFLLRNGKVMSLSFRAFISSDGKQLTLCVNVFVFSRYEILPVGTPMYTPYSADRDIGMPEPLDIASWKEEEELAWNMPFSRIKPGLPAEMVFDLDWNVGQENAKKVVPRVYIPGSWEDELAGFALFGVPTMTSLIFESSKNPWSFSFDYREIIIASSWFMVFRFKNTHNKTLSGC